MSDTSDEPRQDTKGGERPGDSLRELRHPEENVGATDEEQERQQDAVRQAAEEAERLRNAPDHHPREGL